MESARAGSGDWETVLGITNMGRLATSKPDRRINLGQGLFRHVTPSNLSLQDGSDWTLEHRVRRAECVLSWVARIGSTFGLPRLL